MSLFGYNFWFKNRTPRMPFGRNRHPYRNLYRLIASLIVLVYVLISQNDMVKDFNNAMKTAMIETGELPAEEQPKQDNGISDANDKFISRISGLGFRNIIKNNSKIVIYKKGNNIIEPYKNSADWNTKFEFAEFVSTVPRSNRIFKKYCGEICIIDMQKKKYIAIPKDKLNDNNYLYEALVKFYN